MENLTLISAKPLLTLTSSSNPRLIPTKQCFGLPLLSKNSSGSLYVSKPRSRTVLSAFSTKNSRRKASNNQVNDSNVDLLASTSTAAQETTSVGVNPQPYVPPPSQFGSPLFWIGVGVGFSAIFSFGASWLKKYAMQQAFKSMMGQAGSQNNQFSNSAFPSGSPFGFPPPSASGPSTYPGFPYQPPTPAGPSTSSATGGYTLGQQSTSRPATSSTAPSSGAQPRTSSSSPAASVTMDVSANTSQVSEPVNDEAETKTEIKQSAFVDISPEETMQTSPFENYNDTEVLQNGAASKEGTSGEWSQGKRKTSSMTVETFEKLMEDPKIQKMILPLLPQEMRDPATFKWMLQNPVYRQQLQDMLDNMGEGALDDQMMESLKNFDLNSPEVKQQFDQIGLTPEEAMSRIMSKPEIAMAFQNPKIQQAIMDCSANPMNIMKYQNDKEVMDVFNQIQELFPGSPGF